MISIFKLTRTEWAVNNITSKLIITLCTVVRKYSMNNIYISIPYEKNRSSSTSKYILIIKKDMHIFLLKCEHNRFHGQPLKVHSIHEQK